MIPVFKASSNQRQQQPTPACPGRTPSGSCYLLRNEDLGYPRAPHRRPAEDPATTARRGQQTPATPHLPAWRPRHDKHQEPTVLSAPAEYEVEDIAAWRFGTTGTPELDVAWKGYPGQNTWEPRTNIFRFGGKTILAEFAAKTNDS